MRLFVAVALPAGAREALAGLIERLRASAPDAKWVPAENLHLTLCFLGEVAEERVAAIVDALEAAAASSAPATSRLAAAGAFPSDRRARVLWVGLDDDAGRLSALAGTCAEALEPLGFPRGSRPWTPHVTLARFRVPFDLSGVLPVDPAPPPVPIDAVTLYRSLLARPAPRYEPVAAVPLGP